MTRRTCSKTGTSDRVEGLESYRLTFRLSWYVLSDASSRSARRLQRQLWVETSRCRAGKESFDHIGQRGAHRPTRATADDCSAVGRVRMVQRQVIYEAATRPLEYQ